MTPTLTSRRAAVFRSCGPSTASDIDARPEVVLDRDRWVERAAAMDRQIAQRTLPFWFDHAYLQSPHGYRFGHRADTGPFEQDEQLIVSQARLLWTFSRAHRLGYSTPARDYLRAARHGALNLNSAFLNTRYGGYAWRVRDGRPTDSNVLLYGQSFALYALVEYSRATDDTLSLEAAMSLFRFLTNNDNSYPLDLAGPDLGVVQPSLDPYIGVASLGYRCANSALHWMEALIELYRITEDALVGAALAESVEINRRDFYPRDLAEGKAYVPSSPGGVAWPHQVDLSYGHNVEFGWLMIAAQQALGVEPDWARLESIVAHTLRFGFDHQRGGVFSGGRGNAPAHDRRKSWWQQAEMIAALTYLDTSGFASRSYAMEFQACLDWYFGAQMDSRTMNPFSEVADDGTILDSTLSSEWQAAYHDLRARWIFIGAHSQRAPQTIDAR